MRWHVLVCRVERGGPVPALWSGAAFYEPNEEAEILAELRRVADANRMGTDTAALAGALTAGAKQMACFVPPSRLACAVRHDGARDAPGGRRSERLHLRLAGSPPRSGHASVAPPRARSSWKAGWWPWTNEAGSRAVTPPPSAPSPCAERSSRSPVSARSAWTVPSCSSSAASDLSPPARRIRRRARRTLLRARISALDRRPRPASGRAQPVRGGRPPGASRAAGATATHPGAPQRM